MIIRDSKGRFMNGSETVSKKNIDEEQIIELYKSGLDLKELSKRFGYSDISSRIANLIKKEGISRLAGFYKGHKYIKNQFGKDNHMWKGGKRMRTGYREILIGNNKYILEHRLVWIRDSDWHFIPEGFVVHHRNQNRLDNRIENLSCIPHEIHTKLHWHYEKENGINRFGGRV